MPPRVRRALLTSLGFLVLGVLSGLHLAWARLLGDGGPAMARSAHTHALLVGFLMIFILGVADWFFPRPGKGSFDEAPKGPPNAAYWHLTIGTALRWIAEISPYTGWWPWVAAVAATIQAGGLLLMGVMLYQRIGSRRMD